MYLVESAFVCLSLENGAYLIAGFELLFSLIWTLDMILKLLYLISSSISSLPFEDASPENGEQHFLSLLVARIKRMFILLFRS